ncbi:IclR family transcriptional regulator [Kribbella solani]|uniref:IclR family transcriptional regulator n=1 Tax=Kribbella solani TaxID=236067 RepID=UPI0029AC4FE1|nr:IclR family transcriptional regulator [Kribbella solani]MDX3005578.1 IclR family transcriptional regulator [Kribbella solani]
MKNRPAYAIDSVDHALVLAQMLRHEGQLRVSEAAERLGVSPSTAHRLLAMLVYRDFAERSDDRRYFPGRMLRPAPVTEAPLTVLRRVAGPHLRALTDRVGETSNLVVVVGTETRFVMTTECTRPLRVGDRMGQTLPAHLTAGGQALLAVVPPAELASLYETSADVDLRRLRRELALVRKRGFAINDQRTETGVTAVSLPIPNAAARPEAAITLAMPTARFNRTQLPDWITHLASTATQIKADLTT